MAFHLLALPIRFTRPDTWSLILAWLPWYALGIAVETPIYFVLGRYFLRRAATTAPVPRLLLAAVAYGSTGARLYLDTVAGISCFREVRCDGHCRYR